MRPPGFPQVLIESPCTDCLMGGLRLGPPSSTGPLAEVLQRARLVFTVK